MVAIKEKFRIKRNKKKLKGSFILLLKVFIPPSASSSTVENGQEQRIRSRERIHAVNNYGREQDNGWKTSSNCLLPKTTPYLSMPAVQLSSSPPLRFSGQNVFARFIPCFRRSSTPAPNLRSVFNFISAFVVENIVHLLLQWNIAQKFPNATMEIFVKKKKRKCSRNRFSEKLKFNFEFHVYINGLKLLEKDVSDQAILCK